MINVCIFIILTSQDDFKITMNEKFRESNLESSNFSFISINVHFFIKTFLDINFLILIWNANQIQFSIIKNSPKQIPKILFHLLFIFISNYKYANKLPSIPKWFQNIQLLLTLVFIMIESIASTPEYYSYLEHEFSAICAQNGDTTPPKPLMVDIINRQQILFMQFEMEKKGKNFGITERRLLKIEDGQLFQTGKGQQEKIIPFPLALTVSRKIDNQSEWQQKERQFEAKIIMHFGERSDITVYFRSIVQSNQIAMFLMAQIQKADNRNFEGMANLFKFKVAEQVLKKIQLAKQQSNNFPSAKLRAKVNEHCRRNLNDRACLMLFLEAWRTKTLFHKGSLNFRLGLCEVDVKTEKLTGIVKIWGQGAVHKQITITQSNTSVIAKAGYLTIKFSEDFAEDFANIGGDQELQVEVELNGGLYKTERLTANDLKRMSATHKHIELNLTGKSEQGYIRIVVGFQNSQLPQSRIKITPQHYRIIDQLYNPKDQGFQLSKIHQHYQYLLSSQRAEHHYYTSCNRLRQIMQLLRVEELIDKFFTVEPFIQHSSAQHRGTFIYEYFLRCYQRELYYDVEKLIWNHQEKQHKRLLTALKVFDQNLKFIFTDGFYKLVTSLHALALRETTSRWREGLFERSVKGIESIAFFLTIGFLKAFPGVFVHQEFVNKRALPYNSLLFVYVLRKLKPGVAQKLEQLEINIEAYFGCHFVSLFCSLFEGDTLARLMILFLNERKEDGQSLHMFTLVGAFLTVMGVVDSYNCSYASAEHYMLTFYQICKNIPNKFAFFSGVQQWRVKVKDLADSKQFQELSSDMTEFYLSNAYSGQLGEVAQQIYQEFTCYHYKNQNQLRKILLLIDRIEIGEQTQALTLAIFQAGGKIYEHEFKGVPLQQLGHFIELRLLKLEELTIICSIEQQSFLCRLDPKQVPSNLYFHIARQLRPAHRLASQRNRHILFQAYIKDNCEIDALENPIPNKYREILLEEGLAREDLLFCRKYSRTFRMRENNFNLLYSKLGWFGCHYLVPDERLIGIEIIAHRNGGQQQLHSRVAVVNRYTRTVYGKALAPYPNDEQRGLSIEMIKEGIRTHYSPQPPSLKSTLSQASIYNSASRLASYALDNFHIHSSVHFLQFYYDMVCRLPLLGYLSYRPRLFYLLPTFTLQVTTPASACTVIISEKGLPLRSFSQQEVLEIELMAQEYNRLPTEVEFGYTDTDMYLDDFLAVLRLNILKRVVELDKKEGKKGRRWGSTLASSSVPIPNYKLHNFYQAMNETKQIVQLQFREKKLKEGISYNDFGLINGRWTSVHCLAIVKNDETTSFLVVEEIKRRKYVLKQRDFIRIDEGLKKTISSGQDIAESFEAFLSK